MYEWLFPFNSRENVATIVKDSRLVYALSRTYNIVFLPVEKIDRRERKKKKKKGIASLRLARTVKQP
jgi:hypothetical protein